MAVTGEMTGRQCWEVHKDAVTGIIEKHIKDPALVKRLTDAWDSAVDLGVTTAKASPAQKKKKTDRAIRLTSVRQATSVLLSQIGLITLLASGVCKKKKTLFPNAELNLLSPGSGCPLQAGTGHGRPGRAPGRC